jgi:hypothetical protein
MLINYQNFWYSNSLIYAVFIRAGGESAGFTVPRTGRANGRTGSTKRTFQGDILLGGTFTEIPKLQIEAISLSIVCKGHTAEKDRKKEGRGQGPSL